MANGKVSVNSDAVSTSLTYIVQSCSILENDVSTKLPGNFQSLVDLAFFSDGHNKIQEQLKSVITVHKDLISQISSHLDQIVDYDNQLRNKFKNYGGYSNNGGGTTGDEKKISVENLIEYIPKLDDNSKENLIKFIDAKKDNETSFIDLLFDTSKSEELFILIKQAFKVTVDFENLTLDDYVKVQKNLLDMICNSNIEYKEITENSILIAKDYLNQISKNNNINASDLILDSTYRKTLQTSLLNLYDGNGVDDVSSTVIQNFRNYIDSVASKNNMTYEELLTNNINLIL